jgi:hypothetical protein
MSGARSIAERLRLTSSLPPEPAPLPPGGNEALDTAELRERRDGLALRLAEVQFDLGGLVYEMAQRDHFRLDVLVARAAVLQDLDAQLAEADRILRLEEAGAAGACPSCGSLYARGSAFCSRCGTSLAAV